MKHIIEKWEQKIYESAFWDFYFGDLKTGVLDIETTGLNPGRNKFVLGCLYDVAKGEIHQVLAESRAEEPIALAEYSKLIEDVDMVITYNGRHFDMPFIEKRRRISAGAVNYLNAEMGRRNSIMTGLLPYDLDLFLVLNGHSPIKKLVPNMKQKTIEEYMGFWDTRADEISGAESVQLFNIYENTRDLEVEKKILLHNNDDVRQLTRLTKAIIKSDFHRAMYKLGFPVKCGDHLLIIDNIQIGKESLCISGTQSKSSINYMGFEYKGQPVTSAFHEENKVQNGSFEITIPTIRQEGYKIVDLEAIGIEGLEEYPGCDSGFLVIQENNETKYREINHFAKVFIRSFMEEIS